MSTETAMANGMVITEPKRVVVADTLGYCWGVRRALDIIQAAADEKGPVAPVGDIIHNPQVVERLRAKGVEGAASVDESCREAATWR